MNTRNRQGRPEPLNPLSLAEGKGRKERGSSALLNFPGEKKQEGKCNSRLLSLLPGVVLEEGQSLFYFSSPSLSRERRRGGLEGVRSKRIQVLTTWDCLPANLPQIRKAVRLLTTLQVLLK